MLWVYVHGIFFRVWGSESDVNRRQILTSKDGPRAERVNVSPSFPFENIKLMLAI